jgi:hypothetical protein
LIKPTDIGTKRRKQKDEHTSLRLPHGQNATLISTHS